jgi:uncharacterized Zn-binding protein involved in type VI secretion
MPQAARKGDPTIHLGMIVEGSPDVSIGGMPAARLLDKHVCPLHGPGPITQTSFTVYINGVGAARMGDKCTCMVPSTAKGGGDASKEEHAKFTISPGIEKKFGEKSKEWEKDGKEPWKEKPEEPKKPFEAKVTADVSKEFGKFGNDEEKKGAFETGLYSGKGTAKAGVEADLTNLRNAKAEAGAKYEVEGTAARLKGKAGDTSKGSLAEGEAEAKLLTAKAEAGAGGKLEMKDGKLDAAYVEATAGAGGSVVEGKASGKTKAFKLPFVNWGISFGGEVSGALLTAEAKASAHAGYKDHKWSFGFGAKVGAALAGLGFKFNVTIEKVEPPAAPAPPPGIPGVAGIDPIAMGCLTVEFGGMPPPYVPGPPAPEQPPATQIDGIGKLNSPLELTLKAAKKGAVAFTPIKCEW